MTGETREKFNIPKEWKISQIGAIFNIKQGKSLSRQKQKGNLCRKFLRTSNIFWGRLNLSTIDEMNFTEDECKKLELQYGDLLVCEGGDIGRTAIWRNELFDCYYQNHLHRLRTLDNTVSPFYVMFWLQAGMTQLGIYEGLGNKTTIPNLSRSRLSEFDIFLPLLPEQNKIAAVLYKIQKAIEMQEKIIESIKELKKSTMQHLFTKGTRGEKTKQTEIGEIPESWKVLNFIELATLHRGYDLPEQSRKSGNIPIIGSNGLVGFHNVSKIKGPGVVTGRSGSIGISYYIVEDFWPLNTGLYVEDFHGNSPLYTHYFFESFDFRQYISGVSVPTLNRNFVHTVKIPRPGKDEQQEIAKILLTIDNKIEISMSKKTTLQTLFKSMLNKLMTGDIRVKDLEIDVSEIEI